METSAHYIRVGIFVIVFTAMLIVGLLWLSVGLNNKTYQRYLVYMHESVSGLSIKAPVKYNGVEIGYVDNIRLYKKDPQKVRLVLAIESKTPIYGGTSAVLETQGLTGIAYMELKGGDMSQGLLQVPKGHKYPIIPSAPSLLFRLDAALDNLTSNIRNISSSLQAFLNPENARAVQNTLQNFSSISDDLKQNSVKLDNLIDNAKITFQNTADASKQLPGVMQSVQQSAKSIQKMSDNLVAMSGKADVILRNGAVTTQTLNDQLMPEAVASMANIQTILNNLENVTQQMSQDPAVLIRGRQPPAPGPGE
jgi:phospholipid/cholesterol/gamma-HCH transport system substrate-binding protein